MYFNSKDINEKERVDSSLVSLNNEESQFFQMDGSPQFKHRKKNSSHIYNQRNIKQIDNELNKYVKYRKTQKKEKNIKKHTISFDTSNCKVVNNFQMERMRSKMSFLRSWRGNLSFIKLIQLFTMIL
jgi:ribosomal protein L44E